MKVIATGGLAELIAQETSVFNAVAPWLTLEGLRLVYEMNEPRSQLSSRVPPTAGRGDLIKNLDEIASSPARRGSSQ